MPESTGLDLTESSRQLMARMRRWKKLRRTHITHISDFKLEDFSVQKTEMKPHGLWYGFNESWMDWCSGEMSHWLQPYIYEILTDDSKILRITNEQEMEAFENEYHDVPDHVRNIYEVANGKKWRSIDDSDMYRFGRRSVNFIAWGRVAEKYGALEVVPYIWEKRLESMWYYGWDCASGCIWSKDVITDVKLIAAYDDKSDGFVRV